MPQTLIIHCYYYDLEVDNKTKTTCKNSANCSYINNNILRKSVIVIECLTKYSKVLVLLLYVRDCAPSC